MAKGAQAKEYVTKKIAEAFGAAGSRGVYPVAFAGGCAISG